MRNYKITNIQLIKNSCVINIDAKIAVQSVDSPTRSWLVLMALDKVSELGYDPNDAEMLKFTYVDLDNNTQQYISSPLPGSANFGKQITTTSGSSGTNANSIYVDDPEEDDDDSAQPKHSERRKSILDKLSAR